MLGLNNGRVRLVAGFRWSGPPSHHLTGASRRREVRCRFLNAEFATFPSLCPRKYGDRCAARYRAKRPIARFLRAEFSSGLLLLVATAFAVACANSSWAASYIYLWQTLIGLSVGPFKFERSLQWFVNDGLMVIFFFVVGLEFRGEVHEDTLSTWRRAALPGLQHSAERADGH